MVVMNFPLILKDQIKDTFLVRHNLEIKICIVVINCFILL